MYRPFQESHFASGLLLILKGLWNVGSASCVVQVVAIRVIRIVALLKL